jgi:2-polyprenyl-3-methyl-5-hydroxy-6-metoxy-1,4-benzoquinol methylase
MDAIFICPACASAPSRVLTTLTFPLTGRESKAPILDCGSCDHRFLGTSVEEQHSIEGVYDHHYKGYREDPIFADVIRRTIRNDLARLLPQSALILDVGCGNGEFMKAAIDHGYQVEGIDVSEEAVRYCTGARLTAQTGDFLSLDFSTTFDAITMWDVLEHLREPEQFIVRSRALIKPGGLLILKVPAYEKAIFYPILLSKRLATVLLGAPAHVQYFTGSSLAALLNRCGFSEFEWLPHRIFRSAPPATSLKKRVARAVSRTLRMLSGSRNLYVAARTRADS